MVSEETNKLLHFTYKLPTSASLEQGDLIRRTPAIESLLSEIHPHFSAQKYKHFVVLTQSCDLVIRDAGRCKAPYIAIAPVRSITDVAKKVVAGVHFNELERKLQFASDDRKARAIQAFERIFNNNESPYFYFYRQPEHGLMEDCCAILSLSIAVRSDLHYPEIKEGRILSLNDSFQHKLGYLVGTLYSRVGTQDWDEESNLAERAKEIIERNKSVVWIPKELAPIVTKILKAKDQPTSADLLQAVAEAKKSKVSKKEAVLKQLTEMLPSFGMEEAQLSAFQRRFRGDPTIKGILGA